MPWPPLCVSLIRACRIGGIGDGGTVPGGVAGRKPTGAVMREKNRFVEMEIVHDVIIVIRFHLRQIPRLAMRTSHNDEGILRKNCA